MTSERPAAILRGSPLLRALLRAPTGLYDAHAGWLLGSRFLQYRELAVQEASDALADYERRNRWLMPIVRWVLSRLVGWRYDGSVDARLRLVGELPVMGLRPY